ncbi:MAG: hypothetical protein V4677_03085 [Bacteroidota bacterium]
MDSTNKDQDGKPLPMVETDVLGLEKNKGNIITNKAKPNRIFIGFAILIVIAIIYWLLTK